MIPINEVLSDINKEIERKKLARRTGKVLAKTMRMTNRTFK